MKVYRNVIGVVRKYLRPRIPHPQASEGSGRRNFSTLIRPTREWGLSSGRLRDRCLATDTKAQAPAIFSAR
jgi:hypothetical protein